MKYYRKFYIFMGVAVTVILTAAACSSSVQPETADLSSLPDGVITAEDVSNNLPSDIKITVYQGAGFKPNEEIALSELLAQGKPVVLNFWAGLCPHADSKCLIYRQ